jgi:hypothetical protein
MTSSITTQPIPDGSKLSSESITEFGKLLGTDVFYRLLREKRNSLLKNTDWTVSLDSPLKSDKKQEWTTYRQALRDVPQNIQNINDIIVWPSPPST